MEKIKEHSMLKIHPDTVQVVRKDCNLEKAEDVRNAVDSLEQWVMKQNHFKKKDFPRRYLEAIIMWNKGSVERAKARLDKICTLRTLLPQYFCAVNAKDLTALEKCNFKMGFLPQLTKDNYRVMWNKLNNQGELDPNLIVQWLQYTIMGIEYELMHDYISGHIFVIDYLDANILEVVKILPIPLLHQCVSIIFKGYGMRVKHIHLLSGSASIGLLVKIMKAVLSEKLASRIHVHKSMEELSNFLPRDIFPKDFGGKCENSLEEIHYKYIDLFSTKENTEYMKEINAAGVVETQRLKDYFYEEHNLPGSFRSLAVD